MSQDWENRTLNSRRITLECSKRWNADNPEYHSVHQHHRRIFNSSHKGHGNYKGMPFYDGWNPDKGGSFVVGRDWIKKNLGPRPGTGKDFHLHVINKLIGFVPGNLMWVPAGKHKQEELIATILKENKQLRDALADCKCKNLH